VTGEDVLSGFGFQGKAKPPILNTETWFADFKSDFD
jgi:hypothetical protein